jgi:outer membrane protein OmpA-like peptidoglycan-associated protein
MSGRRCWALTKAWLAVSVASVPIVAMLALGVLAAPSSQADSAAAAGAAPPPPPALRRELDRDEALLLVQLARLPDDSGVLVLREPERVILRIPARLLFEFDSAALKRDPVATAALTAGVQLLKKRRRLRAEVVAYTDSIGGSTANQTLSDQRAQAIGHALGAAGIAANRLQQHGAGATEAVASNETPQGRVENRRIEIEFRPGPAAAP